MRKRTVTRLLPKLTAGLAAAWLLLVGWSTPARAHGGQGISAEEAGAAFVEIGRYQLLLERKINQFVIGRKSPLIVRIYDSRLKKLVSARKVLLAVKLPQIVLTQNVEGAPRPSPRGQRRAAPTPPSPVLGRAVPRGQVQAAPRLSPPGMRRADPHQAYLTSPLQWTREGRPDLSSFEEAVELTPGHYRIFFRPSIEGPHFLKVAFSEGGNPGRIILTQFYFQAVPPPGWNWRFLAASGLFLLTIGAGAAAVGLRRRFPDKRWREINLLDLSPVRRLFQWRHFQRVFQIPFLVGFVVIVILGFFDTQDAGKNLATRLTWTIWWAGVIFTFVLVGRVWCLMCPYGAATDWTSRALRPKRRFPKPLRNLWLANLTFLGLTWADGYFGLVGDPRATAWFLLLVLLAAVGVGAFFPRRTFCRYVCPLGGLIGLYSMFSPVELRTQDKLVCKAGKEFDCYMGNDRGYGCPMFEDPRRMDTNIYCTFCGECIKTCTKSNIALRLRPFGQDLWAKVRGHADEAVMAVALVGVTFMAIGHMITPWHQWMDSLAALLPFRSFGIVDHTVIERVMYTLTLVVGTGAVLYVTWLAAAMSRKLAGDGSNLSTWDTLKCFGYMFIPIGLAAHLSHNLLHLFREAQMVIPAFQKTVNAYTPFFLGRPNWRFPPLMGLDAIYWLQMGVLLVFFGYTLFAGYRISRQVYTDGTAALRALSPMILLALAFALLNVYFLSQGMNPRHAH